MLYYGLIGNRINDVKIINYSKWYRIPEILEFFNDIPYEVEVLNTNKVFNYINPKLGCQIILPSYVEYLEWCQTTWKADWLYSIPKGINNQDIAFEQNMEQLQQMVDNGLIRIKLTILQAFDKQFKKL